MVAALLLAPLRVAVAQTDFENIKETLSRTGVFFRADAPYVLRNAKDPNLPIHLQIINGVEKTGKSAITRLAPYVTREPLELEGVNLYAKPPGARRQFPEKPLLLDEKSTWTLVSQPGGEPLEIKDRWEHTLQIPREKILSYLRKNFLGALPEVADLMVAIRVAGWPSQNTYLRVRLKAGPLPQITGWYRGDMHYHSSFTDNAAERGHPLEVTRQAALHTGLHWVVLADHSTDLNPERFAQELEEVRKLRDDQVQFIRGEELTTTSGKDTLLNSLHLVALPSPDDPDRGFSAGEGGDAVITTGDGSPASPAMPLRAALERVAAAGGFAYAAHPFDPVSPVLRGGEWDLAIDFLAPDGRSLAPALVGLEPWNRATTVTAGDARDPYCLRRGADPAHCFQPDDQANHFMRLERGIERGWRPLLARGLGGGESAASPLFKVFIAAGSDAHGDFNYEATMDSVDFLSKPSRGLAGYAEDNALGKLTTVVYCPQGMGARGENVLRALRAGQSVISNGPLLVAAIDADGDGKPDILPGGEGTIDKGHQPSVQIQWASTPELGPVVSLRLIRGTSEGETTPHDLPLPSGQELTSQGWVSMGWPSGAAQAGSGWSYLRFELRTRNSGGEEFRCYTNPLWVREGHP
jgi:hypothetical protein